MKVDVVCGLWSAYRASVLSLRDVRLWFAAHELVMRRCNVGKGVPCSFTAEEAAKVCDLSVAYVRASIRRLERAGFLLWSERKLTFSSGTKPAAGGGNDPSPMISAVTNHRRTLPVPRQTVLLLARTRRPVMAATVLGHLMRCMYLRSGECRSWGACKASWVATTFAVDGRNVKAARRELIAAGWAAPVQSSHWHRQRYGGSFVIHLGWSFTGGERTPVRREPPPRRAPTIVKSPPPSTYRNLPKGINHQNPPQSGGHGVRNRTNESGKPSIRHIVLADLECPTRLDELFRQAATVGWLGGSEADRLLFFSAAARVRRKPLRNPAGCFVSLLRRPGLRHHISGDDEARGRDLLLRLPPAVKAKPPLNRYRATLPQPSEVTEEVRRLIRLSLGLAA